VTRPGSTGPRSPEYLTKPLDVPRFLDVIDGILVAARP
jgi:hypothetical protein